MQRHLFFISTIVLMIVAIIYFSMTLREQNLLYFHGQKQDAKDFVSKFRESHQPLAELNLSSMYGSHGQVQILHPIFAMQSLRLNIPTSTCGSPEIESSDTVHPVIQCDVRGTGSRRVSDTEVIKDQKRKEYTQILQGKNASFDFILNPPFVDESGMSYAYLLSKNDIAPFNSNDWVKSHLSFFKPTELKGLLNRYKISDRAFETISQLTEQEIKLMVEGSAIVMTPNYLLLKNESRLGFSPLSYWAYDIRDVRAELRNSDHDLVQYSPDIYCLEKIGNACWTYSSKTALAYVYRYSIAILSFAVLIFFLSIALYSRHIAVKDKEQRRHRTSLQVLSHEFRTPVTAMLLLIEELSKSLSILGENDQDTVTKLSAEIFRLQRIIEMSKTYLQSSSSTTQFNYVTIPSINSWIDDFATDLDSRIECEFLKQDQGVEADPFWLKFALTNLVQNAFAHGKEPVRIRLSKNNRKISIAVEDDGVCEFDSLKKMSTAFVKSSKSRGMGIGLNITSTIVNDWGGELSFRSSPTSFSITFAPSSKGSFVWLKS